MTPLLVPAQTWIYHPFPYSNAIWKFQNSDVASSGPGPCSGLNFCYIDYQYRLSGDTIISGKRYANVYRDVSYSNCPCGPNSSQNVYAGYCGGIRNDTLNKRVYWANFSGPEQLLYDFNWVVGDTFTPCNNTIAAIDSVLIGSSYRKRFITSDSAHFIEGIGSVGLGEMNGDGADLFDPHCGLSMSPYQTFMCYSDSSVSYLMNVFSCNSLSKGIAEIFKNEELDVSISPNPTSDSFTLLFYKTQKNTTIRLTDVTGREIRTENFSGKKLTLQKGDLKSGVYFIQTINEKKNVANSKIIIE
jgi:hypothetical protein